MWSSEDILRLYSEILHRELIRHTVPKEDVKSAIREIVEFYKSVPRRLTLEKSENIDFNKIVHRCAYLFKYAPFHTWVVYNIMCRILNENQRALYLFQDYISSGFTACSIGGGPGTDIVAILTALYRTFGFFPSYNTVIDINSEWKDTFWTAIDELKSGMYGNLQEGFSKCHFNWDYMNTDMLELFPSRIKDAIASANLVAMVKFVSAVACKDAEKMIKKIFQIIQIGCMVLFVDNAAGGYRELVTRLAGECKLVQLLGPLPHELFLNTVFYRQLFDISSCFSTKVCIHLMLKVHPLDYMYEMRQMSMLSPLIRNDFSI